MSTTETTPTPPARADRRARVQARHDGAAPGCQCEFHLSPPTHLHYPAVLLLLAEEPRHGYALVDGLRDLGFGPISRPSVYRALGDLEDDGLLVSWEATPLAGSTRHVYAVTARGHRQLARWMEVVACERDALHGMVDRFATTRAPDCDDVDGM